MPGDQQGPLDTGGQAGSGNNEEEFRYLQGVMAIWKNHIAMAKIPHAAADFALQQVLLLK